MYCNKNLYSNPFQIWYFIDESPRLLEFVQMSFSELAFIDEIPRLLEILQSSIFKVGFYKFVIKEFKEHLHWNNNMTLGLEMRATKNR